MTKSNWFCISVLSALGSTSVALAHGAMDVEKLDTNGDGSVSAAEWEAGAMSHFDKADANHDGKVTADEMKAAMADMHDDSMSFAKLDANSDGKLSKDELAKMPAPMFKKLDANGDGSLSKDEFDKGQSEMHAMHAKAGDMGKGMLPGDANKDGAVTKAEATAEAQAQFKKFDTNGDGKLSKEELAAMKDKMGHGMGAMKDGMTHGGMGVPGGMKPPGK